ncbi:hypothetical protein RchiOBHm_Chr2g0084321 [Rosa chinensis]|uniref:Uncharacterized protein n=1 Tax=Rosa chinensis TaxID=74649 RepID=A0A2P6RHT7_ROSCH|nr:hypothetical protein RchiOBHm_Chr2g0084321 [Rosa chinensis]
MGAGGGRNGRESAKIQNCNRGGNSFDPSFSGQIVQRCFHRRDRGRKPSLGLAGLRPEAAGRGRTRRGSESAERGRESRGERKRMGGVGFRFWKPTLVSFYFYPKVTMNSNFLNSLITFAYELRFLRTTYARARFNALYNFHEGNFLKLITHKKSILNHPLNVKIITANGNHKEFHATE